MTGELAGDAQPLAMHSLQPRVLTVVGFPIEAARFELVEEVDLTDARPPWIGKSQTVVKPSIRAIL
jgi:vancomycin permeability regulator SanA